MLERPWRTSRAARRRAIAGIAGIGLAALAGMTGCQARGQPDAGPPAIDAAITPPPVPAAARAPAAVDPAAVQAALDRLLAEVRAGASDPQMPWALAHGLIAFGRDLKASDGRLAIDVIVSDFLRVEKGADGRAHYRFPERSAQGFPVEPHPNLLVKSMLEAGVPRERRFTLAGGGHVTLGELADDLRARAELPRSDAAWRDFPWTLTLLASGAKDGTVIPAAGDRPAVGLHELAERAVDYTEREQRFLGDLMQKDRPDLVEKRKQDIYAHPCGGLHLIQGTVSAAVQSGDPALVARGRQQLELVLFRWRAERRIYADFLKRAPEYRRVLLTQALKFYGHALETLALAAEQGAFQPTAEERAAIGGLTADLLSTSGQLAGDYAELDAVRRTGEQAYLDLIGDGCHAIRGLREALVAFFRPS